MKKFLTVLLVVITLGVFGQSGTSVKPGVWLITDGTTAKTSTFVDSVVINGDLTVTGITTWVVDMLYNALTGDSITTNFVIGDTITVNKLLWPDANDGAPIGTATVSFSDLFLASGGVINWNNSDVTLTHGSNTLTFAGGNLTDGTGNWTPYARLYGFDTIASTSMITDGTWKTLAGVQTGLVSLTDGTAKWSTNALTGFDTISSTSVLYNGTFKALAGDLSGITSINDGVASWNALHNLTGFNVINADTVTANYFSGTVIGGLYWSDTTAAGGVGIATAYDISDMVEFADTTTYIASQFDLSQIVTGWTVISGTPDTLYPNDSAIVKLNNYLLTDFITDGSKVDDVEGYPLNVGNTMLGYQAFAKDSRAGDSAALSTFIGIQAGYDADTISYSFFGGSEAGAESSNVSESFFGGSGAGYGSSNVSESFFGGSGAGAESSNVSGSFFGGNSAGYGSSKVSESFFGGDGAGSLSSNDTSALFLGSYSGYQSDSSWYSNFIGNYAGATSNNTTEVTFIGDSVGYGADGISHQVWIDDSPTATPLIQGFFDVDSLVINGDLTATGNIQITGDGSPKFQFQIIEDTLCSVRVGIDTVRLHPPR
jgi:hypothetical protein